MAEGNCAGHHCKVCYEQAMKEKARLEALLRAKRNRQLVEPPPRPEPPPPAKKAPSPLLKGCVFAKSCALPDGIINYSNPNGFVPVESLSQYGAYSVLGMGTAVSTAGTALEWIGGSGSAIELAKRLGGQLVDAGPAECENNHWHGAAKHDLTRQRVLHVRAIRTAQRRQYAGASEH